jgi:DNA modification methylase
VEGSVSVQILIGDCRERLQELPDASVHCCVTSPPYFGLRDYGVDGQMGLEPTPDEFVAGMVEVFRDVRRVLRDDGTLWLNIGDSYAGSGKGGNPEEGKQATNRGSQSVGVLYGTGQTAREAAVTNVTRKTFEGIKAKDLIGIPWMLAFALRADGWFLRQDIIWSKPNPMPESVRDRCTKAHEFIFLLSKSPRYYFDAAAISERVAEAGVVEGSNLSNKVGAFGNDFGLQVAPPIGARPTPSSGAGDARRIFKNSVRLASAILDVAQPQDNFSLLSLNAEIGQQRAEEIAGSLIGDHPIIRWASPQAARFADGDISAEQFLHELHRLWVALPDGDKLKEAWRFAFLHIGLVNGNGDGPIGVHDASDVGEIGFLHSEQGSAIGSGSQTKARRGKVIGRGVHGSSQARGMDGKRADRSNSGGFPTEGTRNKRSVWEVATQPFSEAHFATYPPSLIEPCILAGCPKGGTVLDPFGGAGTTGLVADRLQRDAILIELNPQYAEIAQRRLSNEGGMFADVKVAA